MTTPQAGSAMIEAVLALLVLAMTLIIFQRWAVRAVERQHIDHQVHLLALTLNRATPEQLATTVYWAFPPDWPAPVSDGPVTWMWQRGKESVLIEKNLFHFTLTYCATLTQCYTSSRQFFAF